MSNVNIFQNSAKSIPTSDDQIVRVDLETLAIGGRKSHLPNQEKSGAMNISHTPSSGTMTGSK